MMPEPLKPIGFLSRKAGGFSGVPQRTLQSWAEKGILTPSLRDTTGKGVRRLYSVLDCILIGITKSLSDERLTLQQISPLIFYLRENRPPYEIHRLLSGKKMTESSKPFKVTVLRGYSPSYLEQLLELDEAYVLVPFVGTGEPREYPYLAGRKGEKQFGGDLFSHASKFEKMLVVNVTEIARKVLGAMD